VVQVATLEALLSIKLCNCEKCIERCIWKGGKHENSQSLKDVVNLSRMREVEEIEVIEVSVGVKQGGKKG